MRDYGTGEWEGGDPDCDHVQGRPGAGRADGIVDDRAQRNRDGAAALTRSTCVCGAHRVDRQLGLEPSPDEYVARMVEVFREVRRVLRDDGTVWLNIGDSYAQGSNGNSGELREGDKQATSAGSHATRRGSAVGPNRTGGTKDLCKPKDLVGIPWMLAFALRAGFARCSTCDLELRTDLWPVWNGHRVCIDCLMDGRRESKIVESERGWWLRSDVIWAKPNPMPESVTDRPTKAHEYLFLLAKSPRYFYDVDAIREDHRNGPRDRWPGMAKPRSSGNKERKHGSDVGVPGAHRGHLGRSIPWTEEPGGGRNRRTVWEITTESYAEAHFATFPQALVEPCIKAGTSEYGCCPECGAPWERKTEPVGERATHGPNRAADSARSHEPLRENGTRHGTSSVLSTGVVAVCDDWAPSCDCAGVDLRVIETPTGSSAGEDPTMKTGRAGMNRPRGEGEGSRPMTRYEQAQYARQLREHPLVEVRRAMLEQVGETAFAYYARTDDAGARPIPPGILEEWIGKGWLRPVEIPETAPLEPIPCTVMDPFMGSGTTAFVARKLGRRCVGIELNPEYADLIAKRTQQLSIFG